MTSPAPLRARRDLRDHTVDGVALVLCVLAMLLELVRSAGTEVTPAGVAAIVAASLPVLLRRRRPVTAFVLAMTLLFGVLTFAGIYQAIAVPAVICAYALARARGRQAAAAAAAVALPIVVLMLQIYSPHPLLTWDTVKNLGFVALPLALGVAAHDRRTSTTALLERAESAERTREEEALRRVGEERLRIARDVHDTVAHAMVAINVQAGVGAHLFHRDPDQARSTLREIKSVSGQALEDLRALLGVLRVDGSGPADGGGPGDSRRTAGRDLLDGAGLLAPDQVWPAAAPWEPTHGLADVHDLRDRVAPAGIEVDVLLDPALDQLSAVHSATSYRIVQEALTNVMRHAGPTHARVTATRGPDEVVLSIEDDGGAGPVTLTATGSGNGVRGMRERAATLGGTLEAGPRACGGWRVVARLPLSPAAAARVTS